MELAFCILGLFVLIASLKWWDAKHPMTPEEQADVDHEKTIW